MTKVLWLTDLHLMPWRRKSFVKAILSESPEAVFLTGDIANLGFTLITDLTYLAERVSVPIYFVLGNHDFWFSSFAIVAQKIRSLCQKYPHLVWLTEAGVVPLNSKNCLIGTEGFYSGDVGNQNYIKYTLDWIFIKDFRALTSWDERFIKFRELAEESAADIKNKLQQAFLTHQTVYLLTHYPPWVEANQYHNIIIEKFWEAYNNNLPLGQEIEKVMVDYPDKKVIVCAGHSHFPIRIKIAANIECRVGKGSYYKLAEDETLFI